MCGNAEWKKHFLKRLWNIFEFFEFWNSGKKWRFVWRKWFNLCLSWIEKWILLKWEKEARSNNKVCKKVWIKKLKLPFFLLFLWTIVIWSFKRWDLRERKKEKSKKAENFLLMPWSSLRAWKRCFSIHIIDFSVHS